MDGIDYSAYKNHENGWRGINRKDARYYASFFHVNVDWLLDNIPPMKGKPNPTQHHDILAGLPPEGRQQAMEYIDLLKLKYGA